MDLFIALLPAIIMIIMVLFTKKVIPSLLTGVIFGALIANNFDVVSAVTFIVTKFYDSLTGSDTIKFTLMVGSITAIITIIGGTRGFANWAVSKIKNEKSAQFIAFFAGIAIFIDDYFNALVIGEISKPITDNYKISRAKLAYIIDSTSAPVVILLPLSTWGAYIIGIIDENFISNSFPLVGSSTYWQLIPYQFYAIAALLMVIYTITFNFNLSSMKRFEEHAFAGNDISKSVNYGESKEIEPEGKENPLMLIIPIVILILTVFISMIIDAGSLANILDASVSSALVKAGAVTLIVATLMGKLNKVEFETIGKAAGAGFYSMIPTVIILALAFTTSTTFKNLGIGDMAETYLMQSNISLNILPVILFLMAGGMAFATGTSYGTFGILLPIAIQSLAGFNDVPLMLVSLGAVLSGSVFGDHCSPISDTTVLSSTGARSTLEAHFSSQLPYALIAGLCTAVSYFTFGLTSSLIATYVVMVICLAVLVMFFRFFANSLGKTTLVKQN